MAKNFGARKNSDYKVVSTSPSVNKTPRGDSTPDIPYDVQEDLSGATNPSPNVFFNGDPAYLHNSHSTKVTGDARGSKGGVKSGTVGGQSDPIEASPTVFINGQKLVRVGDVQYMQNKNTVGKVVSSHSGSAAHITDQGEIVGLTQPPPIPMPYPKNKPTNNPASSGQLGSFTGSPVLLASGKLLYRRVDLNLVSAIPIIMERTYVSGRGKGIFGWGWECIYEKRLVRRDPHTLLLYMSDDRTFAFTHTGTLFDDTDGLGGELVRTGTQTFELEYFSTMVKERYENSHLVSITDKNGNRVRIIRDALGKIERIETDTSSVRFEYNRSGAVSRLSDHTMRIWSFGYDKYGNLISVSDPLGGIERYHYGIIPPYNLDYINDPCGVTILSVLYDSNGRVASYHEEGKTYRYAYEENRIQKTDDAGHVTEYALDAFGSVRAVVYPDGSQTYEEFNDNVSRIVDIGGNVHERTFDRRGRLIRYLNAGKDGYEHTYTYEADNPKASIIHERDCLTLKTYDGRYNLTSVVYPEATSESWGYDDRGNIVSHTDINGATTLYAYNEMGLCIRSNDAMGGISQYVYDSLGNMHVFIDPNERVTRFEYDRMGRMIKMIFPDHQAIRCEYDLAGRLISVEEGSGSLTSYRYDQNGFLSAVVGPDLRVRTFVYDKGLLVTLTREDGMEHAMEYDERGRLKRRRVGSKEIRYSYDSAGNLICAEDGMNRIEYVYDSDASVLLELQGDKSVRYAYDSYGMRNFVGYAGMHFTLLRNSAGILEKMIQGGASYQFSYSSSGKIASLTYPNHAETRNVFDPLGRLSERHAEGCFSLHYLYDKTSRIVRKNDVAITYDEGYRIKQVSDRVYAYDGEGNLVSGDAVVDPLTHRLLWFDETRFQYDATGRMIEKNAPSFSTVYTYDDEGYLIRYQKTSVDQSEVIELNFTYDPLGRRLTKRYKSVSEEYAHRYLYAGDDIVAIYDADTDEVLATLLHAERENDTPLSIHVHPSSELSGDEETQYAGMDETERLLFQQQRIKRYYYHLDHQNSVMALSDDNGKVVESYEYDAYGNIVNQKKTDGLSTLNPYRFTSREYDTPDLYYYRARYYDPTIGRFITPDPIGFLGGDTNLYRYVFNDPVNFIDYSGFSGVSPSGAVNPSQGTLSNLFVQIGDTLQNIFTPNGTAPSGPKNGGKIGNYNPTQHCEIKSAYFAEDAEQEVIAEIRHYAFNGDRDTSGNHKKSIAQDILNNIKPTLHPPLYTNIKAIKETLTKSSYKKGEIISYKVFKKEKYSKRINEASIGQKVNLVASFGGCPDGQNITFKIYEKSPLLVASGQELIVLQNGAEVKEINAVTKNNFAVVQVELRPKKEKKSSPTDTSLSLELWQEKFNHTPNTPEKFDYLWLKVTAPAKNSPKEFLKASGEALKVKKMGLMFPLDHIPSASYTESPRKFGSNRPGGRLHAGCDLLAPVGTKIYAMADGKIIDHREFYGQTWQITVDHGDLVIRYGEVKPNTLGIAPGLHVGSTVKQGQHIGYVGLVHFESGGTAHMLHLEMYDKSAHGSLSNTNNPPYMRRNDLINPTSYLIKASQNLPLGE